MRLDDKLFLGDDIDEKEFIEETKSLNIEFLFCEKWYPAFVLVGTIKRRGRTDRFVRSFVMSACGGCCLQDMPIRSLRGRSPGMRAVVDFLRHHYRQWEIVETHNGTTARLFPKGKGGAK